MNTKLKHSPVRIVNLTLPRVMSTAPVQAGLLFLGSFMKEIKLTRGNIALVDDKDYNTLNQFKWYCSLKGYAVRHITIGGKRGTQFMHRVINNTPKGLDTDHINRDKLDNRKSNLRSCTHIENLINHGTYKNNKLGINGVHWDKRKSRFKAQIQIDGKQKHLGSFKTAKEASVVFARAEIERLQRIESQFKLAVT